MIARNLIETGFKDLFKFLVEINSMFLEDETAVRILNEEVDLTDFSEKFDVEVDVGIGFGVKRQEENALAVVGNFYPAFVNNLQIFTQMPEFYEKFRNYYTRILVTNNIKDVDTYLPTVEEVQMMAQQIQQAQQPEQQPGAGAQPPGGGQEIPPELLQQMQAGGMA